MDLTDFGAWSPLFHPLTFLVVVIDVFIPAVPSEFLVIASGTMASEGTLLLPVALLTASLGSWLGDIILYLLFRNRLTSWLDKYRWGRFIHRSIRTAVTKAGKSPTYAGLIALRFLPAGRTAGVAAAGIANLPLRPFLASAAVGGILWGSWLVMLGYITDVTTGFPLWVSALLGMGVGTLVGLVIAAFLALKQHRKAKTTDEHPDAAHPPAAERTD
ncbi:VTT domain-containing protein [Arthrobacter sp. H20]|uniref:DedA family protein n=1 Tax=Arthrobacter sp. H20 TaxID=1267981 RepID=UPI0004B8A7C5|nr:VTT domain-containing protein [Arthrobacter sp. H20]